MATILETLENATAYEGSCDGKGGITECANATAVM